MKKKSILKSWLFTLLVGTSAGIVNAQGNLQIGAGATLFSNGTSIVTLQNAKLTNNGSYTASNGTLLYTGSATNANASANGSGTTQLKNLTVNKSANALQINKNVAVATALTLTAGGVELVAGNIDFGTTGSLLSETATNRAYGTGGELRCTAALSAPSAQNPANLGVVITSAANLGTTTVYRGHSAFSPNGSAINRYYKITPTTNTGLNATLRFNYFDAELNGNNEATMQVWYSSNSGATWSQITASNRDAAANWVEVTGVNALGWFTLAPATAVPTTKTWTGTTSTAWATSTNWNPAGAPTCSDDILIPNTTNKPVISAAASAQNLTIQAGGGITINAGQTLSLCGNLANSGIVSFGAGNVKLQGTGAQTITGTSTIANLEVAGDYTIGSASIDKLNVSGILKKTSGKLYTTDKLTLLSTSTQTALIQENGGLLSGNATMQRYIGGYNGFHHLASPINNATVAQWADDYSITGTDGVRSCTTGQEGKLQEYRESQNNTNLLDSGYYNYTATSNVLVNGRGYTAIIAPTTGFETYGQPNSGTITISVTKTGTKATAGWNFLGNPYPSPISWTAVKNLAANTGKLNSTCYLWHANSATNYKSGSWVAYNGTAGTGGVGDKIASHQGFFVLANATNTITFDNTVRTLDLNPTMQKTAQYLTNEIRLELQKENATLNEIVAYTDENETTVSSAMPTNPGNEFAFVKGDAKNLIEVTAINKETELPLHIQVAEDGYYTINNTLLNVNGDAYLWNKHNNSYTLLSNTAATVQLAAGDNSNFSIVFKPNMSTGYITNNITIYGNHDKVIIVKGNDLPATVIVSNLLGQELDRFESSNSRIEWRSETALSGQYIISVVQNNTISTQKVFINK